MSHDPGGAGILSWQKFTLDYTKFQTNSLANAVRVVTLPTKSVVHAGIIKHTQAFGGGLITILGISLGIAAFPARYAASLNVLGSVSDTSFSATSSLLNDLQGYTTGVDVIASALAVGANLSALTQGSLDVYLLVGVLPP